MKKKKATHNVSILFPQGFTAKRYPTVRHEALVRSHLAQVRAAEQRAAAECLNSRCTTITHRGRRHIRATLSMLMPRACCSHFITQTSAFIIYQVSQSGWSTFTNACRITHTQVNMLSHTHTSFQFIGQWPQVGTISFFLFNFSKRRNSTSDFFDSSKSKGWHRVLISSVSCGNPTGVARWWCNVKTRWW